MFQRIQSDKVVKQAHVPYVVCLERFSVDRNRFILDMIAFWDVNIKCSSQGIRLERHNLGETLQHHACLIEVGFGHIEVPYISHAIEHFYVVVGLVMVDR